jgi:hypothetical protein
MRSEVQAKASRGKSARDTTARIRCRFQEGQTLTAERHYRLIVYAVVDDSLSPTSPLGDSFDVFVRREDAERFIQEIRGDEPELAKPLRIEEREA